MQAIGVYTFLGVWAMIDIKSMKFTLGVVATFWSFILTLVTIALMLNRNQTFNFMGPTPVSRLNNYLFNLLPSVIGLYV